MNGLRAMLEERHQKRQADAEAWKTADTDLCMACGAYGADKRSLLIDCGYAVDEVAPLLDTPTGYRAWICKSCRAALLDMLGAWWESREARRGLPMDHDGDDIEISPERNIPVRRNGATVWLTREEWEAQNDA